MSASASTSASTSTSTSASASASASASTNATTVPGRPNLVLGSNYGDNVDVSKWVVLYPPYIDAKLKEKDGRKIGKDKCVDNPSIMEIFDCAQLLGLQTALEMDKAYCRDYWRRGRIRVRLFDADKKLYNEDIPNRRTLYARIAALIPEHRTRSQKAPKKSGGKGGGGGTQNDNAGGKGGGGKGGGGANNGGKGQPKKKKKGKR